MTTTAKLNEYNHAEEPARRLRTDRHMSLAGML